MTTPPDDGKPAPAIDLAHLERQTMGDVALQRRVLELFAEQAAEQVTRLESASADERRRIIHTLVGAARGIGAFAAADAAAAIRRFEGPTLNGLDALKKAIAAARDEIACILAARS